MRRWLHWKYHYTWDDPCTVSLGVGVVFAFELFSCVLVCLPALFICLSSCLFAHLICFHFCLCSFFALLFVSLLVSFHKIVSHETMYDFWRKLGKVKEALCCYHYLVIYHPASVWRTCYFQSMVRQWKICTVQSEPWWKHNACALTSLTYSSRLFLG